MVSTGLVIYVFCSFYEVFKGFVLSLFVLVMVKKTKLDQPVQPDNQWHVVWSGHG